MEIYRGNTEGKTILELNENEYILIQYLLETSMNKTKGKLKDSLLEIMFNQMLKYDI